MGVCRIRGSGFVLKVRGHGLNRLRFRVLGLMNTAAQMEMLSQSFGAALGHP